MATNNKKKEEQVPEAEAKTTALTMEEMQALLANMLAEAKAETDRMVADAKAEAQRVMEEAGKKAHPNLDKEKAKAENIARGEELVRIKLFRDGEKYKDDVFVQCNGENVLIKRGVWVEIKRKFAEILDNSEIQDYETAQMIRELDGKDQKLADL